MFSTSSLFKKMSNRKIVNFVFCVNSGRHVRSVINRFDGKRLFWTLKPENRTIPNYITLSRIAASPLLTMTIINDQKMLSLAGCVVFGLSDWLDGYIAKNYNQKSTLGAFLDPMADKIMITALTIGLVYQNLIPLPLVSLMIGRDATLIVGSFILRGMERPKGSDFFDTTNTATFSINPSDISKINTVVQFTLIGGTLSSFAFGVPSIALLEPLWWITACTTTWSGLQYLDGTGISRKMKGDK